MSPRPARNLEITLNTSLPGFERGEPLTKKSWRLQTVLLRDKIDNAKE